MSITDSIKNDHNECRGMIARLQKTTVKDVEERRSTFSDLRRRVFAHFLAEEDTILKEMSKVEELRPLTLELIEEHRAIRDLFDVLWATNCDEEVWLPRLAPLSELFAIHMNKEENIVLPAAPKYFTEAQLEALGRVFDNTERGEMEKTTIPV
jgi:hemerythrin superfamily protein